MRTMRNVMFLGVSEEQHGTRYIVDALIALLAAAGVTTFIYLADLYPRIPNISILYLLVVLGLASIRGMYSAIIASLFAFISFDYWLIEPRFTLSINKAEEWLALAIFLVTAIITGQLASALRQRAEEALLREKETRALYELVNATTNATSLEQQLRIVSQAVVTNFAAVGVRDCAILLPDPHGKPTLLVGASDRSEQVSVSQDEEKSAGLVLSQGRIIDVYVDEQTQKPATQKFTRVLNLHTTDTRLIRLVPLRQGQQVVGVVRLVINGSAQRFPIERNVSGERLNHQSTFFWTFLDQSIAMIERERLRQESMQVELLRRTDALRAALLSSVSHDLRTPLSSIKAAASSLLQRDVEWDEATKQSFAQAIEREADRLNRLVGNLLDMSRIEGGALKPEKELYPLNELINDVVGHMQSILQGRELQLHIPEDLPPVELDYLQIDQVVTNLLENAVRYTPQDSPLEVSAQVIDNTVVVGIADRGPGIPAYDLERIFDKFYRVSGAKRSGTSTMGTGLGLAVCKGIIEAHGGQIWAENRRGGGAVFRFTLPL